MGSEYAPNDAASIWTHYRLLFDLIFQRSMQTRAETIPLIRGKTRFWFEFNNAIVLIVPRKPSSFIENFRNPVKVYLQKKKHASILRLCT